MMPGETYRVKLGRRDLGHHRSFSLNGRHRVIRGVIFPIYPTNEVSSIRFRGASGNRYGHGLIVR